MKYIVLFIIFAAFYSIFDWIIRKADIHNKLFNKHIKKRYVKIILGLLVIFVLFWLEYMKGMLRGIYGDHSYISVIAGAFLSAVYLNFIPLIFKKDK